MNRIIPIFAAAFVLLPQFSFAADAPSVKSGRAVYESVCIACHAVENVMVAAPKAGDVAEWRRRLVQAPKGMDTLTDHAIAGFGAMPPKGGRDELTRDEIRNAIVYMMEQRP
jgi:cytochrome c5